MNAPVAERASGVLLHITSLPGPHGSGDLGPAADAWIDFLARAKQRWWQMLPVTAPGPGHSPYNALSAHAGDARLISPELLARDGLLSRKDLGACASKSASRIEFSKMAAHRDRLLRRAYQRFAMGHGKKLARDHAAFCRREQAWLDDFALFCALKGRSAAPWTEWDAGLRKRKKDVLRSARRQLGDEIAYHCFVQFIFFRQWTRLRARCARRGVSLLGDVPAFVAHDSADVWSHQELFRLDGRGRPTVVAGVPPDRFSRFGQRWGNPLYRWDRLRKTGYDWWLERFRLTTSRFDAIRLDHFVGFQKQWQISARAKSARTGRWIPGPGAHFFAAVNKFLGGLPFVAEDLGSVTEDVTALRENLALPGMRILQFAFSGTPDAEHHLPHSYERNAVVYTGTHDNDTTVGWLRPGGKRSQAITAAERRRVADYLGGLDSKEPHWDLVRLAWSSSANLAIAPMQDLLGLDSSARMNVPGTTRDNWRWRLLPDQASPALARRLSTMTRTYARDEA